MANWVKHFTELAKFKANSSKDTNTKVGAVIFDERNGVEVVVVSGRDGSCEQETRNWLIDNGIFFDCLFMRKAGDSRKDAIIKEEILFDCIAPVYNILFWVDDRPQVVRKIKDLGINVIDVSKSYEEF